jgi:hypothetical protein
MMGVVLPGDEAMHYENGSHRWVPQDPRDDQAVWEIRVREHQEKHPEQLLRPTVRRRSI